MFEPKPSAIFEVRRACERARLQEEGISLVASPGKRPLTNVHLRASVRGGDTLEGKRCVIWVSVQNAFSLLAADSFRVRLGARGAEVRAFSRHLARFRAAVASIDAGADQGRIDQRSQALEAFLATVGERVAAMGAGFPRLEATVDDAGSWQFSLRHRETPPLTDSLSMRSLRSVPAPDAERKGPNIERYAAQNAELDAEALLVNLDGTVREGATTSLVWVSDGVVCGTPPEHRVSSITEGLVRDAVAARGGAIEWRPATIDHLRNATSVWAVNALHGVRSVRVIDGEMLHQDAHGIRAMLDRALENAWEAL